MKYASRHWLLCASVLGAGFIPAMALAAVGTAGGIIAGQEPVARDGVSVAGKGTGRKALRKPASQSAKEAKTHKSGHVLKPYRARHVETMTVTGSFLSLSKNSNANPVQTISSKQIMQTGMTNLGDFLQRMPSVGTAGTSNSETNGTGGASCTDLRNLGQNRVLVLVDGKRIAMDAQADCVDMNTLPVQLISGIDILKDGSSALYGSDAVSGVINIKLRHDVNTGGLMVRGGITGHGDGRTGMLSAYKGWNFDEGRGNITFSGAYNTTSGIRQKDRSWANPVVVGYNNAGMPVTGSGYGADPTYQRGDDIHRGSRYDFGRDQFLTNDLHTGTLYGDAHYDFNRHFTLYSNVLYTHRNSLTQMAPEPYTGGGGLSRTLPGSIQAPADYPVDQEHAGDTLIGSRLTSMGVRRAENASDTYTVKSGLKGDITEDWKYDASFTYGWNQVLEHDLNIGSYKALLNVWGLKQQQPGVPNSPLAYDPSLCPSSGCESPFKPLSAKGAAYVNRNIDQHSAYQMRDWNLRIHNNRVFTSPWDHGGRFGLALGMERRSEQLSRHPDGLVTSGEALSNYSEATGGGFHVVEGYMQGNWNLLHNAFLAKDLTIDGEGRLSGYNGYSLAKNWKTSINWMPVRDVHFRGTLGTSFRHPNVTEQYAGQNLSYNLANDPCDLSGGYNAAIAANCTKAIRNYNSKTYTAANSGQIATIQGGTKNLKAETSRTYTFGIELTPRWIRRFSTSVEYWHTSVANMIGAQPTQYILDQCYSQGKMCNLVHRYDNTGQIATVDALNTNLGGLRTGGIDFDLNYSLPLTEYDVLTLNNMIQQVISYQMQQVAGGQWYNYDGRLLFNNGSGTTPGQGVPRLRDYATFTWRHNKFAITYMMSYMSGMRWNDGSVDQTSASGNGPRYSTPGIFSHDVTLTYNIGKWNLEGGIQNIANKRPPFVLTGTNNTASQLYGNLFQGRYFFVQAGVSF